jgi:hypothetical protein
LNILQKRKSKWTINRIRSTYPRKSNEHSTRYKDIQPSNCTDKNPRKSSIGDNVKHYQLKFRIGSL